MNAMEKELFVPVTLGTAREGRKSEAVAHFVYQELSLVPYVQTQLVDVRDFLLGATIPGWEDHERTRAWREIAKRAEGFVFVIPEYNRGYPGEFKLLLDSASGEYLRKPAAVVSVSSGAYGGAAVAEAVKPVLTEVGLVPLRRAVRVAKVGELLDEQGKVKDDFVETYRKPLANQFDDLLWYARALSRARAEHS